MGRVPAESAPNGHAAAAWQHGRVPCSAWIPLSPAFGKRQRMPGDSPLGFALAATSPAETAVPPQALWMLKRHSALVRVIAAGSAAQRRCLAHDAETKQERPMNGRRKEGEGCSRRSRFAATKSGLHFRDGEFKGLLGAGRHWFFDPLGKVKVEVVSQRAPVAGPREARRDRQVGCAQGPRRGPGPEGLRAGAGVGGRPVQPHPAAGPVRLLDHLPGGRPSR